MRERKQHDSWGPENPRPLFRMNTELVWEGKYDEYGNRRPVRLPASPLPLQRIETIDEPRDCEKARQRKLFEEDALHHEAQRGGFRNSRISGYDKTAVASLLGQSRGQISLV